jgi:AP-3 complex subunit delta-1
MLYGTRARLTVREPFMPGRRPVVTKPPITMNRTSIADTVSEFIDVQYTDAEREFTSSLMRRLEQDFKKDKILTKCDCIQHLIFVDLLGQHTAWADFSVLEVMACDDYSAKRIAYTASDQLWTANSDVVLMATNRVQRDLTSSKPFVVSVVLSSIPPYLSLNLAQHIANDVIKLMTSSKDFV